MRIPHYLTRAPSGRYIFRLRVPDSLRMAFGRTVIKHTLRTADTLTAHRHALELASRYAHAFECVRGHDMTKKITAADVLASVAENGASRYELDMQTGRLRVDGPQDHALAMKALREIGRVGLVGQPPAPSKPKVAEVLTMGEARKRWLKSIEPGTLPKTLDIKRTAVEGLETFIGTKRELRTLTRADLAGWYQSMRDAGISDATLPNKQSYIGGKRGFFAWAMASGYYPQGDNIAAGHVSYTSKDKRKRKKFGFQAFTMQQVQAIFHPTALALTPFYARWALVIGLYTGARVSEVGQLLLLDIVEEKGVLAFHLRDDGEGQSLKNVSSYRVVPVHPDLLALGIREHVAALIAANESRLFPNAKPGAKNGAGSWITKAVGHYLPKVGGHWPKAKRGFHSLRKSFIQELQTLGVASELRAQIVGHELDDEHHGIYSRDFTAAEKLNGTRTTGFRSPGMKALTYGLNLQGLRPLLTASVNSKPAKVPGRKESSPAKARKRASTSGKR